MPGLDALHAERAEKGLAVIGLTQVYKNGYLPVNMQELKEGKRGGTASRDMDEAAYLQHLADFRKNTGVRYPFAVGTKEDFKAYGVTGIPSVFVLDKQGRVAFVAVGGAKEHLLRIAVDRLLAEPSANAGG
ncbi:MAG: TlpA family protein disulfide reductase [Planctomycetes bacterium]|nr:TlpA family protein disulfide reductase [Planctomycetota bacterium]